VVTFVLDVGTAQKCITRTCLASFSPNLNSRPPTAPRSCASLSHQKVQGNSQTQGPTTLTRVLYQYSTSQPSTDTQALRHRPIGDGSVDVCAWIWSGSRATAGSTTTDAGTVPGTDPCARANTDRRGTRRPWPARPISVRVRDVDRSRYLLVLSRTIHVSISLCATPI
jgi:hypothetical protein